MIVVPVKEGENIERALKKFKRKYERTGIVKELRSRQAFGDQPQEENEGNLCATTASGRRISPPNLLFDHIKSHHRHNIKWHGATFLCTRNLLF